MHSNVHGIKASTTCLHDSENGLGNSFLSHVKCSSTIIEIDRISSKVTMAGQHPHVGIMSPNANNSDHLALKGDLILFG
jgi:gamma-glutamyl:cysteine ligase YbdK (ATP-grasp superfamily)